jgi:hypothetical protein
MAFFLGALLAIGALAVVIWPFLRRGGGVPSRSATPLARMAEMRQRRDSIYREMRTLETEVGLGQVDSREYEERRQLYRLRAAELLREEEDLGGWVARLDQTVEEEIQAVRRPLNGVEHSSEGQPD